MNKTWILILALVIFFISLTAVEAGRRREVQRTARNPFRRGRTTQRQRQTTRAGRTTVARLRTTGRTTTFARPPIHSAPPTGKAFQRIFFIYLANQNFNDAVKNPILRALAAKGTLFTNYRALGHPGQTNYIGSITGSTFNINDENIHALNVTNVVDQLESVGLTWKVYAENYPGECYNGEFNQRTYVNSEYFRSTNPFMSMNNIRRNPFRCDNIVNAKDLRDDLLKDQLPNYSWYIPNGIASGKMTNLTTAARWLAGFLQNKINNPSFIQDTLLVVTFDQSNPRFPEADPAENNHVWTVAIGSNAPAGVEDADPHTHYSLLSTVQTNWLLGSLGRQDQFAPPLLEAILN